MTEQAWLKVIGVNLNGVLIAWSMNWPNGETEKRCYCNMSSILGKVGFANSSHYAAAKHGVLGLTQTAAWSMLFRNKNQCNLSWIYWNPDATQAGISSDHAEIKQHIIDLHLWNVWADRKKLQVALYSSPVMKVIYNRYQIRNRPVDYLAE